MIVAQPKAGAVHGHSTRSATLAFGPRRFRHRAHRRAVGRGRRIAADERLENDQRHWDGSVGMPWCRRVLNGGMLRSSTTAATQMASAVSYVSHAEAHQTRR